MGAHQAACQHHLAQGLNPNLVVTQTQILGRRQRLACAAHLVDVPLAGGTHRHRQRHGLSFPRGMEQRLVGLGPHRPEPLRTPHVMDPVHGAFPACAERLATGKASPVPIMLSRVTKAANSATDSCSLPSGRLGITKYRTSAVESQT